MTIDLSITDHDLMTRVNILADELSHKLSLSRYLVLWRLYDDRPQILGLEEIPVEVSNEALRLFIIEIRHLLAGNEAIIAAGRVA